MRRHPLGSCPHPMHRPIPRISESRLLWPAGRFRAQRRIERLNCRPCSASSGRIGFFSKRRLQRVQQQSAWHARTRSAYPRLRTSAETRALKAQRCPTRRAGIVAIAAATLLRLHRLRPGTPERIKHDIEIAKHWKQKRVMDPDAIRYDTLQHRKNCATYDRHHEKSRAIAGQRP
jgi:hypothetical protein